MTPTEENEPLMFDDPLTMSLAITLLLKTGQSFDDARIRACYSHYRLSFADSAQ